MYVDDRLGRRSRARSGLDQLDVAEDLFAVVAAAVAVVVTQFVVHVLDHGRGADRRITINRVGRRRVALENFFEVIREGPNAAARDLQVADHAVGLDVAELVRPLHANRERRDLVALRVLLVEHGRALGRYARVAALALLARPLVVVVVEATRLRARLVDAAENLALGRARVRRLVPALRRDVGRRWSAWW